MDAKSLREKMKEKAKRLSQGSSEKVDSSTFTPAESLDADVKTGMRPVSKRAFKFGGVVAGGESMSHGGRRPRKSGGKVDVSEKVGLANTDQKTANEAREGKKHVGGFKKGGIAKKADGGMMSSPRPMARPPQDVMDEKMSDAAMANAQRREAEDLAANPASKSSAPAKSIRPRSREEFETDHAIDQSVKYRKKGGAVEGSPKDKAEDKVLAKKHGMSMKEWEKSPEDKAHDKGCTCKACGGSVKDRVARKSGGKVGKGKTNINIIISPHHDGKLGTLGEQSGPAGMAPPPPMPRPPMPSPAAAPPMGGPGGHMALPPGLGAALAGAAGAMPPPGGGMPGQPPQPMMARKSGGRVSYPITTGSGGGNARLEKKEAYGMKMNKDLKK